MANDRRGSSVSTIFHTVSSVVVFPISRCSRSVWRGFSGYRIALSPSGKDKVDLTQADSFRSIWFRDSKNGFYRLFRTRWGIYLSKGSFFTILIRIQKRGQIWWRTDAQPFCEKLERSRNSPVLSQTIFFFRYYRHSIGIEEGKKNNEIK